MGASTPYETQAQWYAAYTCVNQEKQVADGLRFRGIETFLPLYRTVRRRTDRRVVLHLPLFPGYLFVRIQLSERLRVLELPRVVRLVGSGPLPSAIPTHQIEALQTGASNGIAKPCDHLGRGSRVRVITGPFSGLEGILQRRRGDLRVVISVELIARSFSIEVGEEDVECVR
jgi:transcription antitermination factor NusG